MVISLTILGFVVLLAGGVAARYLFRTLRKRRLGLYWLTAEVAALLGGVGLGTVLFTLHYHYSPNVRIIGFRFPAAFLELYRGYWDDYAGPLTLPAALGNFLVGVLAPQIILAPLVWVHLRRSCEG